METILNITLNFLKFIFHAFKSCSTKNKKRTDNEKREDKSNPCPRRTRKDSITKTTTTTTTISFEVADSSAAGSDSDKK